MNILEALKKEGLFPENFNVKDAVNYFYQYRIYISDVVDEEKFSKEIREAAEFFFENDTEYNGDESDAWERFLNSSLEDLIKK